MLQRQPRRLEILDAPIDCKVVVLVRMERRIGSDYLDGRTSEYPSKGGVFLTFCN